MTTPPPGRQERPDQPRPARPRPHGPHPDRPHLNQPRPNQPTEAHAANPHPSRPGTARVSWPLILGLGAIALLRPLARMTGMADLLGAPLGPLVLTGLVTLLWAAVVGLGHVGRPVLTLTLAGVAYAVYIIPLSAVLSPLVTGTLQGPLAVPFAIAPIALTNALWGAIAGLLALAVQRVRGGMSSH